MKEITNTIETTIRRVGQLAGVPVIIKVNRGRNKIEQFTGKVESVYPKIFTVRKDCGEISSFSYSDVLSKNIMFYKKES